MKYRKFNRYEKKEVQSQVLQNALAGEGIYIYRNNTKGQLTLPRPTRSGVRTIGIKQEFQGDNYYMQLVRSKDLILVKTLQTPEQERLASEQQTLNEATMEDKLILDQPDRVTNKGKVEHVVDKTTPKQKLNENDKEPAPEILLNEGPVEGGFVIV